MSKNYEDWKNKQNQDDNPDLKCLSDLLYVTKQYLASPESHAAKGILKQAISCTEKWLEENDYS